MRQQQLQDNRTLAAVTGRRPIPTKTATKTEVSCAVSSTTIRTSHPIVWETLLKLSYQWIASPR